MSDTKAIGVRARVRAELTTEIKRAAKAQLAEEGASGLSLRAVARDLGMASSAVYRYFASREDLLTALIIDAYNAAGQVVEEADASVSESDHRGRFVAMARTLRRWAIDNPHEYALIYGSPVPGYTAPADTIDPATRIPIALMTVLVEAQRTAGTGTTTKKRSEPLRRSLADLIAFTEDAVSPSHLALGVEAWAEIFGLLSLELFGHFKNAVTDPEAFFDHAVHALVDRTMP
nr:hypothetical protein [uncultured bacterium]